MFDLKFLLVLKLVFILEGFLNELFGDIVMVTEFVSCYFGLFMLKDDYLIYIGLIWVYVFFYIYSFVYVNNWYLYYFIYKINKNYFGF